MSEERKPSMLAQITGEINKNKQNALKKVVKEKVEDYLKAKAAADAILADIADTLENSGETPETIAAILNG